MRKYRLLRADPAGNITVFVLDDVPKEERASLSQRIMAVKEWGAEQVGFACSPLEGTAGRMEMAGGEFCGNASRAFGMYLLQKQGKNAGSITLEVSGCDHPITVTVRDGGAEAEMPLPLFIRKETVDDVSGTLVHLGGIAHFVVEGKEPRKDFMAQAEPLLAADPSLDAYGVIFVNGDRMDPLIKVPSVNSLVWEGSCGSGTLAAAVAQSDSLNDGTHTVSLQQPAGTVSASVTRQDGQIVAAKIGGPVAFSEVIEVEL